MRQVKPGEVDPYKAVNPHKKGTLKFMDWQGAYLAGKVDGQFQITLAHINASLADSSSVSIVCERCNGTGFIEK